MASCLGIYIEENLIKYAKVIKERDTIKIDSFGVKFSDNIQDTIQQIIKETFSYKIPVYVNSSKEEYKYFKMFSLLNKVDLKKAVNTEFESYCSEKGFNINSLVSRYALTNMLNEKDKLRTILTYINKLEINKILQQFGEQKISGIVPLPIGIVNIAEIKEKENIMILNLESDTTLTTIINGSIYSVKRMQNNLGKTLEDMNMRENSFLKAYEILKNITMYISESQELQEEENNIYLEQITLELSKMIEEVKQEMDDYKENFEKIYITGTGVVINNIDLFFQENFLDLKCEILRPFFLNEKMKVNMKDFIEVNSAVAIAMQGLGFGIKEMNFKKQDTFKKIREVLTFPVDRIELKLGGKGDKSQKDKRGNDTFIKGRTFIEKIFGNKDVSIWMTRVLSVLACFALIYGCMSANAIRQINNKQTKINEVKENTTTKISQLQKNISDVQSKTSEYEKNKQQLEKIENEYMDKTRKKNAISILLNEIMSIIPQEVTITSIDINTEVTSENNTVYKAKINAKSKKYEYLGYLKAKLKTDGILRTNTVISSAGVKQGEVIEVTIEGELP
ncbi:MAG: hypothetical protein Q4G05_00525 [Clostridia bacterium]|nr:hypothetical protein [Clostridia bacterium]